MLLLDVQEFQLIVVKDVFKLIGTLELTLVELLGGELVGGVLEVRAEKLQMLLLTLVVLSLKLFEGTLFFVQGSQD